MLDRLLITLGIIVVLMLAYAFFSWLQRRRATLARRSEATSDGASSGATDGAPRVLYFRSDTCTSCATQTRLFGELDRGTLSLIEKVDVDREKDRAAAYNVMTLPTTVVMDETGEVKHINYGVIPPRRLKSQLSAAGD